MILSDTGRTKPIRELSHRLAEARSQAAWTWARSVELRQWTRQLRDEAREVRQRTEDARREWWSSPAGRELLRRSQHARLLARLETMPVIEQAKGVIMAQSGCGPAQAFDLLRRASQRENVPVRELATRIVARAAEPVTPDARAIARPRRSRQPSGALVRAG